MEIPFNNVVCNKYNLKFFDLQIESLYTNYSFKKNKKNIIFSIIILLANICIIILSILKNHEISIKITNEKPDIQKSMKMLLEKNSSNILFIYFVTFSSIINIVFNVLSNFRKIKKLKVVYLTYFCLNLVLLSFRNFMYIIYTLEDSILILMEVSINFTYLSFIKTNFILVSLLNIFVCIIFTFFASYITHFPTSQILAYLGFYLLFCIYSYINEYVSKRIFFINFWHYKLNKEYKYILDNFENGYVSISKNNEIKLSNKYFDDKLSIFIKRADKSNICEQSNDEKREIKIISQVDPHNKTDNPLNTQSPNHIIKLSEYNLNTIKQELKSSNYIDSNIFNNLDSVNNELPQKIQDILLNQNKNLNETIELMKSQINQNHEDPLSNFSNGMQSNINKKIIENHASFDFSYKSDEKNKIRKTSYFEKFVYIGIKKITNVTTSSSAKSNSAQYFKMYLRVKNENSISYDFPQFEFILVDVSQTYETNFTKDEMKKKSMHLAKISHEFKNPVIIISEIAEEISQEINSRQFKNTQENLELLMNLSSYILILVKDFEVLSKKEISSELEINKGWFDIRKELFNLKGIIMTLINKKYSGDEAPIIFLLEISENTPEEIFTDKIRLMQILINLLSNSIKFTQNGRIRLGVNFEEGRLNFRVEDTGVGLTELEAANLFREYMVKSNLETNNYGSGLGLSIVKELCKKLDSDIKFFHNNPQGSIFSFSIDHHFARKTQKIKQIKHNKKNRLRLYSRKNFQTNLNSSMIKNQSFRSEKIEFPNGINQPINTETSFNNEVNDYDCIAIKFASGNLDQMKRMELSNTSNVQSSPQNSLDFSDNFSKTLTVDSNNANKQFLNCRAYLGPLVKTQSNSTLEKFFKPQSYAINLDSFKTKSFCDLKISHYKFELEGKNQDNSISSLTKSRVKFKSFNKNNSGKKVTILVIDDDLMIRNSIIRTIEKYLKKEKSSREFLIYDVPDAVEGLFLIYNSVLNNVKIDFILTDEKMNFMNGTLLVEVVSKIFGNKFPIIMLTSYESSLLGDNFNIANSPNLNGGVSRNNSTFSPNINSVISRQTLPQTLAGIFTKPLLIDDFEKILKTVKIQL
jgi:hypothetical protein